MVVCRKRPLAVTAVLATSLSVAACSGSSAKPAAQVSKSAHPFASAATPKPVYSSTVPTISDGTDRVVINGTAVVFPTTVTDAAWSPNGARLAFVDARGNIDTARPDGSGLKVLTPTTPGVTRSHPSWEDGGGEIDYARKGPNGVSSLYSVSSSGRDVDASGAPTEAPVPETTRDGGGDTVPTAVFDAAETHYSPTPDNGPRNALIYQHQGSSGPEVYISDRNMRNIQGFSPLTAGSAPTLSPDGARAAYVGPNGQIDVVTLRSSGPHGLLQITFGAASPTDLAWSPDGSTIAYSTPTDVETVPVAVPAGATANPPTIVSKTPGVATYQNVGTTTVARISGADPVAQSIAVSKANWPTPSGTYGDQWGPGAYQVYIAPAAPTQDAVALAALQVRSYEPGPLLLNPAGDLDHRVKDEVARLLGTPRSWQTVTILGDTSGVSAAAQAELQAMGYTVKRLNPPNVATYAAQNFRWNGGENIYLVAPDDTPSITIAAFAAQQSLGAILYTDGSTLPAAARAALNRLAPTGTPYPGQSFATTQVYAIGQEAAAAAKSWTPVAYTKLIDLAGPTPAATAALATGALSDGPLSLTVVNPASLADTAAALFEPYDRSSWPVILDPSAGLTSDEGTWLAASGGSVATVYLEGGSDVLPDPLGSAVIDGLAPLRTASTADPLSSAQAWTPPQ